MSTSHIKTVKNGKWEPVSQDNPVPVNIVDNNGIGQYTTPSHTTVIVTTANTQALPANTNRIYALLVNDSDTTMYIKLGAAAAPNQGIRLNANGGSYEMSKELGNLYTGEINTIHVGTGNKTLLVTEGV